MLPPMCDLSHLRGVFPHLDPHATEAKQLRAIHPERLNGSLAGWSQTDHFCRICAPGKMIFPWLLLWMK